MRRTTGHTRMWPKMYWLRIVSTQPPLYVQGWNNLVLTPYGVRLGPHKETQNDYRN